MIIARLNSIEEYILYFQETYYNKGSLKDEANICNVNEDFNHIVFLLQSAVNDFCDKYCLHIFIKDGSCVWDHNNMFHDSHIYNKLCSILLLNINSHKKLFSFLNSYSSFIK